MSFWSNKTEDGNKQFPTCSVRYVLSVESMIRWRWIALVGIFQSSPWLMLVFRHVEPGASSLPVVVVAHAFWLLVLLPCRSSTRSRRDCRCCWSCARWCWCWCWFPGMMRPLQMEKLFFYPARHSLSVKQVLFFLDYLLAMVLALLYWFVALKGKAFFIAQWMVWILGLGLLSLPVRIGWRWLLTPQSDATNLAFNFSVLIKEEENKKGSVCSHPRSWAGWQSEGQAENLAVKVGSGEATSTSGLIQSLFSSVVEKTDKNMLFLSSIFFLILNERDFFLSG